ncbi:LOW QUALITY PROTEIN: nuclear pore complex protein Nup50-like [Thrips palmi]|uniref:LOW QUALITY PROTEIN: nuclear pore complex protein Nup50-like n=1 Tax=Thrips palmi TaxID=161013 RepID=A0A6P8ZJ91_THRPL|nr:LOW QUALITY PROTEIN: nuclear pore complex protein Nup50-like [Thrips palmi]
MSKRSATTELNHDNWCDEEEPESAGVFKKASVADLKNRQFRTARRRGAGSGGDSTGDSGNGEKSVFAGFSGFQRTEPAAPKALFSFLSATPNGNNTQSDIATSTSSSSASKPSFPTTDVNEKKSMNGVDSASDVSGKSSDKEYHRRLKGLNESVSKWISTHVASNPLIILTPVFRDYEKHLANIQNRDDCKPSESTPSSEVDNQLSDDSKKDSSADKDVVQVGNSATKTLSEDKKPLTSSIFGSSTGSATTATFSFGSFASSSSGVSSQSPSSSFCFGSATSSNTTNPPPATFSFGSGNSTSPSAGFSFGAGKQPFTFSNVASTNTTEKKDDNEDAEEDTPPKPDHKPVNEEGATYKKRCKVFFKQNNTYSEGQIGNLFLKPVDGGKTQLIARADTSLGRVLLNFIVGSSLPIQRIGTNNVAVVCIPTPESKPPPVTVLLRVKTSDDADELFKTLEQHKNKA